MLVLLDTGIRLSELKPGNGVLTHLRHQLVSSTPKVYNTKPISGGNL